MLRVEIFLDRGDFSDGWNFKFALKTLKSIASLYNVKVTFDRNNRVDDAFIGYFLDGKRTDVFSLMEDFNNKYQSIHRS